MKTPYFFCTGLVILALSAGCQSATDQDSVQAAKDSNSANIATAQDSSKMNAAAIPTKDDANFLVDAANGGMMEVALGKLAMENSKNDRVKDFGNMMVKDHTAGDDKVMTLAQAKNVTLPSALTPDQQSELDKLKTKMGPEFDKAFMEKMVKDHKETIDKFQNESQKGSDVDIKNFATSTLPTLETHLDSAQSIEKHLSRK